MDLRFSGRITGLNELFSGVFDVLLIPKINIIGNDEATTRKALRFGIEQAVLQIFTVLT